ncbi:DUF4340 domain-containing protein [Robinsoniella peoriensis]|uniref:DUF4340 domain-containing protein n=1 Tax=Robinsoniella peoriensis TaxID=180332 RepID=UPI00085C164A|nr:DUF4340 domain-containing protein [Robinsoniella peoriensis]
MKKKKKLIGLLTALVVLILLTAAYFCLKNYNKEQEAESETEDTSVAVTSIEESDITGLTYILDKEKLEFKKENNSWYYTEDKNFPVDQDKVKTLLDNFKDIKAVRDLGQLENLDDYGLKEPSNTVTVISNNGVETVFYIGNENETTGDYYMYMNNPEHIYTVSSTFANAFNGKLYDLVVDSSFPSITSNTIIKAVVDQTDNQLTLESSRDDSATWSVKDSKNKKKEADGTKSNQLLSNVTSLNFKDYIDYDCKNLDQYGLKDPSAVITLDYTVTHEAESSTEPGSEPASEPGTEPGSETASAPASEPGTEPGSETASEPGTEPGSETASEPGSETASAPGTKTTEADDVQTEESESETQSTKLVTEVKQVILQIGNQTEDGDYYVKISDNNEVHTMSADALKPWLEAQYSDLRKAE